jgi:hypothetical protein
MMVHPPGRAGFFYCEAEYPASWGEAGRKASIGYIVFGRRTRRAKSRNAPPACGGDRDFEPAEFTSTTSDTETKNGYDNARHSLQEKVRQIKDD